MYIVYVTQFALLATMVTIACNHVTVRMITSSVMQLRGASASVIMEVSFIKKNKKLKNSIIS
jgi:hypothetical protein